jgi:hypothetical protein
MSIRVVTPADGSGAVTVAWDNSQLTVPAGSILDVQPGSALEAAHELANLTPLSNTLLADDLEGPGGDATDGG